MKVVWRALVTFFYVITIIGAFMFIALPMILFLREKDPIKPPPHVQ